MTWRLLDMLLRRKPVERERKAEEADYLQARSDAILERAERALEGRGRLASYRNVRLPR